MIIFSSIKKRQNYRIVQTSSEDFSPQTNMITNGFLFVSNRSNASQLVTLYLDSKPITVLCQMGDFGCGDGGWTPVMKINGSQVSIIRWNILRGFLTDDEVRARNFQKRRNYHRISQQLAHILLAAPTCKNSSDISATIP